MVQPRSAVSSACAAAIAVLALSCARGLAPSSATPSAQPAATTATQPPATTATQPPAAEAPPVPTANAVAFTIEDVLPSAEGPVVIGTLAAGIVEVGDELLVAGTAPPLRVRVRAVEAFRKPGEAAGAGHSLGLLLTLPPDTGHDALTRGATLVRQ